MPDQSGQTAAAAAPAGATPAAADSSKTNPQATGSSGAEGESNADKQSRSKAWEAAEQYKTQLSETNRKLAAYEAAEKKAAEAESLKKGEYEKLAAQKDKELSETKSRYESSVRRTALIEEGLKVGLADPSYLAMIDASKLELDPATGEVKGAAAALKALKEAHPRLFGALDTKTNNTTVGNAPPGGKSFDPTRKDFTEADVQKMTSAERKAFIQHNVGGGKRDPMTGRRLS